MSSFFEIKKDEFLISTDPALLNIDVIHQYLSQVSYWAANIPKETVIKSISNSLCFGLYFNKELIGFARLVTDKATFAYLADVFILEAYRKKGLSKWLIKTIHAYPEMQGLRRWVLATKDAQALYQQFGWTPLDEETKQRFMQIRNKNPYP